MPAFRSLCPKTPESARKGLLAQAGMRCAPLLAEALEKNLATAEELTAELAAEAESMVQIGAMLARHRALMAPLLEAGADHLQASIRRHRALVSTGTGMLCSSLLRQAPEQGLSAEELERAEGALQEFASALELGRAATGASISTLWRDALRQSTALGESAAGRAAAEALQVLGAHCSGQDIEHLPALIAQMAASLSAMALPVGCGSPE